MLPKLNKETFWDFCELALLPLFLIPVMTTFDVTLCLFVRSNNVYVASLLMGICIILTKP